MARCRAPSESPLEKRWWRSLTPGIFLKSDIPNVIIELEAEMRAVAERLEFEGPYNCGIGWMPEIGR